MQIKIWDDNSVNAITIHLGRFIFMDNKKKVTFDDIAKYTNFSKTTISRYFNNPDSLTVKNQDIIA